MDSQDGKKVVIAGGTGLVGRRLAGALARRGAQVHILSRSPHPSDSNGIQLGGWDNLPERLQGASAVINLAGEGIADQRWTPARKKTLLESRLGPTQRLLEAMAALAEPPPVLVNASAIGIYGSELEAPVAEQQAPGTSFLAEVCSRWEAAADKALALGVRVVKLRIGVVLAREGGALPKIALPVRLFAGTALGTGRQGFSWIHLEDLVRLFMEAADNPAYQGAINATAPHPCSNHDLMRQIATRLHRPLWPVPAALTQAGLNLLVGEMAGPMLLSGAFVLPARALELGFQFHYPNLTDALKDLL